MKMEIIQRNITLSAKSRGFHLIDKEIQGALQDLNKFTAGIAHIMIQHTSAGLTINENADPSVRDDFESFFTRIVPETPNLYRHIAEGLDDMTSHIKASIIGSSVTVPITNGRFNLGTWQGIYLCEFRNRPHSRNLLVTIMGDFSS